MVGFYRCFLFLILFIPVVLNGQTQLYEKQNVIRVKLEQAYGELKSSSFSRTSSGYVQTGVLSVDILNNQFGALQFKRVFSDGGKFRKRREKFGLHLWYEITFDPAKAKSVEQLLRAYSVNIAIQEAEPLYAKHHGVIPGLPHGPIEVKMPLQNERLNYVPNDPRLGEQWHYNNTGQTGGTAGADIKLFSAWDTQKGSPDVIVSIHDGGVDATHSDLSANMWVNTAELNGTTGVDDDNNGYIDDIHGYNLADGTGTILPGDHGTHVAGTVAATTNNGVGVAGVAGGSGSQDGARLMSCQVFGNGVGGFAESYAYAADNGSIISQNSWGYTTPGNYEQSVLDAIDYFIANAGYDENGLPSGPMQGGIVIFAAGNSDSQQAHYPGYYEPVLAVASTNHIDQKSWYSNYGTWVDISAPGGETDILEQGVLSTLPGNSYGFFQGTSMACPHVSGVAALIVSQYGGVGFTPEQLRYRLVETTDEIDTQNPSYVGLLGTGRMNAHGSLLQDDGISPDAITDLAALEVRQDQVSISWTAPSDTDNVSAASYEIRYSESPITEANFTSAQLAGNIEAQSAGSSESFAVTGLSALTSYYFAIRSFDFFGNSSTISNILNVVTTDLPVIEVTPLTITSDLYVGESEVRQISISNVGEGVLEYYLSLSNSSFTPARLVLQQSETFTGRAEPVKKDEEISKGNIYKAASYSRTGGMHQQSSLSDLQTVMDSINAGHSSITSLIPNPYNFIDGETGNNINDGGNDMYDGGNILGTDVGGPIYYSNNTITTSTNLNNQSYFTTKQPGLMVFAADLNGQNYFEITGNVGADGSGNVDGVVLNISRNGKSYLGFVKRIYGTSDPSVNHLIIVEDNGSVNHEFSTDTNNDYHRVNGLAGVERIYYMLFAGTSGGYIENADMLNIMDRFISLTNGFTGVYVNENSGELGAGETALVDISFDARGVDPGQYLNTITIENNTAGGSVAVETELNVEGAASIVSNTNIDFDRVFINSTEQLSIYLKNTGNEDLIITDLNSDNSVFVVNAVAGTVIPGDSLLLEVNFNPVATGVVNGSVSIISNDPNDSPYIINLSGEGVEPPVIGVTPELLTETLYTGETSLKSLIISNTGNSELTVAGSIVYTGATSSSIVTLGETVKYVTHSETGEEKALVTKKMNVALHDLTDLTVGVFSLYDHSILISDMESRGAAISPLSWPLTDITSYDVVIVNDEIYYANTSDLDMLIEFVKAGGNVIIEADNYESVNNVNYVISETSSSFTSFNDFIDGYLTDIAVHPSTQGVAALYSTGYGGYYTGATQEIVRDNDGSGHVVLENLGAGKFVLMANEMMQDYDLSNEENRIFVNQMIDWLAGDGSWLNINSLSGTVPAQGAESFSINFDASGLYGGTYTADIYIESNDPVTGRVIVPVTLEVIGAPFISPSTSELNFADTYKGQELLDSLMISNTGTETLHISNVTTTNSDFVATSSTFDIEVGRSRWLVVSFTPSTAGYVSGTLIIENDDPNNSALEVALSGISLEPPVISTDPPSLEEALYTGHTSLKTVTISNTGNGALYLSMTTTASSWMNVGSVSGNISAQGTASFDVIFDAAGLQGGTYSAEIYLASNDPATPHLTIPITLEVTGAAFIQFSTEELDFQDVYLGQQKIDSILIQNAGTEVLNINQIQSSKDAFVLDVTNLNLQVGESRYLKLTFEPSEVGMVTGNITMTTNDPSRSSVTLALSGSGMEPPKISLAPGSIEESLITGTSSSRDIAIFNSGNGVLDYEVKINYKAKSAGGRISTNNQRSTGYHADMSRYDNITTNGVQFALGDTINNNAGFMPYSTGMVVVDEYLYVVEFYRERLVKYDPVTRSIMQTFPIHFRPYSVTWDGEYFWIGDYVGNVFAYDVNGNQQGSFSCPFSSYPSMTWNGNNYVVSDVFNSNSVIYELDATGNISSSFNSSVVFYSTVYVEEHSGGTYWGVDIYNSQRLIHYSLSAGELKVINEIHVGIESNYSYAIAHNGFNLLVAGWNGGLTEIDDDLVEASWLTISSESGQVAANSSGMNSILIDAADLEAGEYNATIVFYNNDPEKSKIEIPVFLRVCAQSSSDGPVVSVPIESQLIDPDDGKVLYDLEAVFSSPNELQYGFYVDNPILGQVALNGPILSVKPLLLGSMKITLYAFDDNCGKVEHSFSLTIDQITATDGDLNVSEVKIYPNPMDKSRGGVIEIHSEVGSAATISLTDINGREIQQLYSGALTHGMNSIEVSNINARTGVYLIRIEMDKKVKVLRLMVE